MADRKEPFREEDFACIAEWGFNFVRLPMSYLCWSSQDFHKEMEEQQLREIDRAVEFGKRHGIHVCLNFHRAPGYWVGRPPEEPSLWLTEERLDYFAWQWGAFAERYADVPNSQLSFNLLNEPSGGVMEEDYVRVVRRLVEAIRVHDLDRLIIADGCSWATRPCMDLVDLNISQSTRGYQPMGLTHYKASWVDGAMEWPLPTWPIEEKDKPPWNCERLKQACITPWKELEQKGVGVHVGEFGAFNHTPHEVALAWMKDILGIWKEAGWGWALWNLGGAFGVLDSERKDVRYESFHGRNLDRRMLDLLREN